MKKIKKVTIAGIFLLFNIYSCCFAAKIPDKLVPTTIMEPAPAQPNYFLINLIIGSILLVAIIFLSIGTIIQIIVTNIMLKDKIYKKN